MATASVAMALLIVALVLPAESARALLALIGGASLVSGVLVLRRSLDPESA
jgi:uncharacterized membrane protein HdeD (DUF308 family)